MPTRQDPAAWRQQALDEARHHRRPFASQFASLHRAFCTFAQVETSNTDLQSCIKAMIGHGKGPNLSERPAVTRRHKAMPGLPTTLHPSSPPSAGVLSGALLAPSVLFLSSKHLGLNTNRP